MEPLGEELVLPPGVGWSVACQSISLPLAPIEVAVHDDSIAIHVTLHGTTRVTQGELVVWECLL